ncbi:MAG: phage portal protein, partial [Porticoccaceae bacterium]|nr:phage portal protein [Porticoccaceae bacterium]
MFRPPTSGDGSNWGRWISSISGSASSAGIHVTPDTAIAASAVRACVTLLAESVAQLPCELYSREENGERRKRATDHPLYSVIHHTPNSRHTSFEYYEQTVGCLGLRGNHFSLKEFDGAGYVTGLIPINPDKVQVLKGPDGMPFYHLAEINETLPMRMVHHTRLWSPDGYVGVSPIQTNADVIGLSLATEKHAAQVFANGTTMSGVIERPHAAAAIKDQAKIDAILDKWAQRHSGLNNAFSVAMLQEGMTYKQLAMDNEKAQLLESRRFGVTEICRLYKVPPHMVQQLDKATF